MKHPILYDKRATSFFNLGCGVLKDTIRCIVTEERNGVFELEMTYPNEGVLADVFEVDYIIKADAGHASYSKDQLFRIERIDKSMDGLIKLYAKHVSYLAQSLALEPDVRITNASANEALAVWRNSIIGSHPFTTNSNLSERRSTHLTIQNCQNARQALGGADGSILDVWSGEYRFDNYRIDLLNERGGRANTLISYGRNLTDLDQEENISNTYTSVYPYAVFSNENDQEEIITIPGFVIDAESAGAFAHRRVLPVDFSREFDKDVRPTIAGLRTLTETFIEENEIGVPSVSIALSFVDLTKTLNQSGITYEQVNLCDIVPVYFEKLGIRTHAKVVRIEWNVLLDQYETLEIGATKKTLGDTIREIERDVNNANNNSNDALTAANGRNTVFYGPNEPTANRVGDLWYRPNGEHTELWMWNGAAWAFIMSTAPDEVLKEQIEREMQRVQEELDRLNATLENEVRPDLENNSEALDNLDKELEKINLELSDLDQQLGENKKEIKNINSVELPELRDELDQLNQETLPNMQDDLDQLNNQIIPDLNKELATLDETVSEKGKTLDDLNNIALPALQEALDQINLKYLPDIQGDLDRLNGQIIPELKDDLNHLNKDLTSLDKILLENQQALTTLNTVTIPTLRQDLNRLNNVTLPTVEKDLRDLATELNGLTDLTSEWRYLDTVEIDGGSIRANTITTNHMAANSIHGDRVSTNTLNANRITANTITGDKIVSNTIGTNHITANAVTAGKIASGAVTTDKMTANTINGDRVSTNTLNANRITAGSITTDRMTSNSINGDRITANTLNASKIVSNTITGDKIAANAIQARHLTIADFTNLATVSEYDVSTLLNGSIRTAHGRNWILVEVVNGHAGLRFLELKMPTFKVGDEFNFQFLAFSVGNFPTTRPIIRYHYTDGTWDNAGIASPQAITTTPSAVSANIRITAEPNSNKTLSNVRFFTESGSGAVTGGQYLRQIGIYRRSNGQLIVDGSIEANHITTSAVTSDKILANAVTAGKISAGAVTTDKMTVNTINGDRIQTNTLNASRIVAGSITTDRMSVGTINGDRIQTNTLNANRITAGSITTDRMTANTINGDRITTNTLNANRITAGSITTDRMTAGTINGDRITTNTLNANRITANTITGDRIVANAIGTNHLTANAVTADKITTGAVTASKIATGAITANMITTGTLNGTNVNIVNMNASNITSGSITGDRIQANSIRSEHITVTGDLDIRNYRLDGTAIGTTADQDIILRRGTAAAGQRDRMRIFQDRIRFYVERGDPDNNEGDDTDEGVTWAPPTGRTVAGFIEFNANRITANNMIPNTATERNSSLRNIHIQPADRWITGWPSWSAIDGFRGGGEVRCTYHTDIPVVHSSSRSHAYAPLRARRISITGQDIQPMVGRVAQSHRHIHVLPGWQHQIWQGAANETLFRFTSDIAAQNLRGIETREIIVANNSTPRTIGRLGTGHVGTVTNANFNIVRNGQNRIVLGSMNTNIRSGHSNNHERIVVADSTTHIRGGERTGSNTNTSVTLAHQGGSNFTFNIGQSGTDVASARRGRVWCMAIHNRTGTSSSSMLRVTTSGTIERVTSASKYKINIKKDFELSFAKRILNIKPASWFDRANTETYSSIIASNMNSKGRVDWNNVNQEAKEDVERLTRIGGLIAEDVEQAGLEMYVTYADNGKTIEGVQYDRLWTLLIPLIKDQSERLTKQEEEIQMLKNKLNVL